MSKIGDILNPDDSSRGYEHGYKDGKDGKDRNFSRLPFSPKYLVHPLSDVPADTYIEAYKRGHRDGQSQGKLQEIIPGPGTGENKSLTNNHNSHTMRRGIEGQQELLDEHIAFVNGAFENLEEMLSSEEQELERLDDEGLDEKFKDALEEFLEEERSLIEQLKDLKEDRMAKCREWYDQLDEIFS